MSLQTISQLVLVLGIILTGVGTFGAYHFGKQEDDEKDRLSNQKQAELQKELTDLKSMNTRMDANIDLLVRTAIPKSEIWAQIDASSYAPPTAAYINLLFKSDKGLIAGKVRIKGSSETYSFSTTSNNEIPIAVRNVWDADSKSYKTPTTVEYLVTEKSNISANLSIYTHGWIDALGNEPL